MHINWNALGSTAAFSFLVTVGVVAAFSLGVLALARREAATAGGAPGGAKATAALAGAGLCFAACAAAVGYGISMLAG
ncbi:hypothetical protein [Kitasatospora viridis]|uniref:Uncharacterized protein n=1 Tax=Kitasatospora viridis TaxID=281105 RepID=A0A561UEZ8_9ACTN|nr:hypothetical protein [Kitasatospora viridis]TWF97936.1 hypothetical protein FHX73_111738 [Kitasatospora viridis]